MPRHGPSLPLRVLIDWHPNQNPDRKGGAKLSAAVWPVAAASGFDQAEHLFESARMSDPKAYFLSWRTYGTWLHGDPRGSVDDEHNVFSTPLLGADPTSEHREAKRRLGPPVVLDENQRRIVDEAIKEHCAHKGWVLLGIAVRSNHVHLILSFPDVSPEQAMTECKAWATRALHRGGAIKPESKVWAVHGSTRYLWNERDVQAAGAYVVEGQDVPR